MGPTILVLLSAICCLSSFAIEVNPPTVTDDNGNFADSNSKIIFAALPAGEKYVVDPEAYSYGGLKPLFDGVQGFVNICFGAESPFDVLLGVVTGTTAFGTDLILQLAKWGGGYAACVVIGLLFMIIFPIVGCCFCCCRTCCNNCGGKMVQKRDGGTGCWRACYIITLFLCCAFLGSGIICTYVVNERMTSLFSDVSTTINENVEDFSRYANNTLDQINYVAFTGFNFTAKVMVRDLDNIGPIVGGSVQESFNNKANVDESFDQLLAMDPLLSSLISGLTDVNDTKNGVISSVTTLEASMNALATRIDTTFTNCPTCTPKPDTGGLKSGSAFDPSTMPSFDSQVKDLEDVHASNITALVLNGKKEFSNISGMVEKESAPVVDTIKAMLTTFDGVISGALGSVTDMLGIFDSLTDLTSVVGDLESTPVMGSLTVGGLENYRWMGGLGLTCFVLLIFVLQLLGLVLGCCACCCCGDKNSLPTERGSLGGCAGILLMSSVGLVFIFGALITLLVWITFLIGAPLEQLVCVNLRDPEYTIFKDLIDGGNPANGPYDTILGSQPGYTLGEMMFQNSSIPLTVSGLLSDCDNNEPAWKALFIGNFFNLDQVLDYKATIDVDTEINKIVVDLSSLELLSSDTKTQLTDMSNAIGLIDFTGLVDSLDGTTVNVSFSSLRDSLQAVADTAGTPSDVRTELLDQITDLNRIETIDYAAVKTAQDDMLASILSLNETSSTVPTKVTTLITTLEATQTTLQNDGLNIIKNESLIFAKRVLGIADQFVTFVNTTIQTELGRCKPVSNFYQSVLVNTLCGSVVDSWNGVWFTLGWCMAFMVLGIILSTKLAKHVRKMKELHPEDHMLHNYVIDGNRNDIDPGTNADYGPGKGKVHPI